ncbi:unnamed protein product, partial [Choristocarpus tenellus]
PLGPQDVPPCPRCGSPRRFEFQVLPHLLHFLGVEACGKVWDPAVAMGSSPGKVDTPIQHTMDWGTLAVYTCPNSCGSSFMQGGDGDGDGTVGGSLQGYIEEFVWRQPPP